MAEPKIGGLVRLALEKGCHQNKKQRLEAPAGGYQALRNSRWSFSRGNQKKSYCSSRELHLCQFFKRMMTFGYLHFSLNRTKHKSLGVQLDRSAYQSMYHVQETRKMMGGEKNSSVYIPFSSSQKGAIMNLRSKIQRSPRKREGGDVKGKGIWRWNYAMVISWWGQPTSTL